jgi:hypothetical protein
MELIVVWKLENWKLMKIELMENQEKARQAAIAMNIPKPLPGTETRFLPVHHETPVVTMIIDSDEHDPVYKEVKPINAWIGNVGSNHTVDDLIVGSIQSDPKQGAFVYHVHDEKRNADEILVLQLDQGKQ